MHSNIGVNLINALISGLTVMARKPAVLMAALVSAAFNFAIFLLSYESLLKLYYYVAYLDALPRAEFFALPFRILQLYPFEIGVLLLATLLSLAVNVWVFFIIGKFMVDFENKKASVGEAFRFGFSKIGESLKVSFFLYIVALLYFIILFLFLYIGQYIDLLSIILVAAWVLVGIYLAIKLLFLPVVVGVEDDRLKKALALTWDFSGKHFFGILIIFFLISFVVGAIELLGAAASKGIGDDMLSFFVMLVFALIGTSYGLITLVKYYLNNK